MGLGRDRGCSWLSSCAGLPVERVCLGRSLSLGAASPGVLDGETVRKPSYADRRAFAFARLALQQTSTGRSFGIVGGSAMREPHVSQTSSRRITRSPSTLAA
jgi:hypothetical protein